MSSFNVLTRSSMSEAFETQGTSGAALKALLRETAPQRHESRVKAAIAAAEDFVLTAIGLDRDELETRTLSLQAGMVLWSDTFGVGGRDGVEGRSTTRHPALVGLGKGRKQASDGGAWSAAILAAAKKLSPGIQFRAHENNVGDRGWLSAVEGAYVRGHLEPALEPEERGSCGFVEQLVPLAWRMTVAREGLRRAAGLQPWFGRSAYPYYEYNGGAPTFSGSLQDWSDVINSLQYEMEAAQGINEAQAASVEVVGY